MTQHYPMLQRNLLYTGVTGARSWSSWSVRRRPLPSRSVTFRGVAVLLPSRQSSIENIVAELLMIGSRYHRNLHQDQFGPARAERMQALRDLVDGLEVLSSRLEALPPRLRLLVSERQTEGCSAARPIDADPLASYSADKDAIEAVSEIASDVRRDLAGPVGPTMPT
jgi:hypothetical protein